MKYIESSEARVITRQIVKGALAEWADAEFQTRLWATGIPGMMGSPVEAACVLFDDSALGAYLTEGVEVFNPEIDGMLARFDSLLDDFDVDRNVYEVLADPKLVEVRDLAQKTLLRIILLEFGEWQRLQIDNART